MLDLSVAVLFFLSLGFLQTVQRAEFCGAIVALQAYWPCHLGIDNLNVVRSIGRLLDADCSAKPLPLVKDGDQQQDQPQHYLVDQLNEHDHFEHHLKS